MRLLHAGLRDVALRRAASARAGTEGVPVRRRDRRQSLPLHRLRPDPRGRRGESAASRDDSATAEAAAHARGRRRRARAGSRRARRTNWPSCCVAHPEARIVAGATDVGLWVTKQHARSRHDRLHRRRRRSAGGSRRTTAALTLGAARALFRGDARRWPGSIPIWASWSAGSAALQVRNAGTIGGNIANGSPIGDMPPALIALGAELTLRRGERAADDAARGLLPRLWQAGPRAGRIRRERPHPAPRARAC